jgi:GTP-binding protein LepA
MTEISRIRNLCLLAHIDHGKSTLADRMLEICGAVEQRDMRAQYLDTMDLERERGITIKLQSVRLEYGDHTLHLIDTPGHVDFGYEVSRSLAACEGVILLVDAAQGIEAQTLANCYLALEPELRAEEIEHVLGIPAEDILPISAKTGQGVTDLLDAVVERIPAPIGSEDRPLQALIFDSHYDQFRGVISSIRVMNGRLNTGDKLKFMHAGVTHDADELGVRRPAPTPVPSLGPGEVGYLIAGIKDVAEARSGETVTSVRDGSDEPLEGYQEPKAMVFCGLYPVDGDDFADFREALDKLIIDDGSFSFEPETSGALGFGFRCGVLGLLHMEIVRERLEREFDLALIATAPSVEYRVETNGGAVVEVDNPSDLPPAGEIEAIQEPWLMASIITPAGYTGTLIELCESRRGSQQRIDFLSPERVEIVYRLPLAEVVTDFFDQLKSRSQGYASLDYEPDGYEASNLVKVDVLLNGVPVDAFSTIVHRDSSYEYGKKIVAKLRELIPRQMFDVPIQAAVGGRIIARETVKAKRKDVLAKCYGGDITRKRKLLEQQKKGKKRMKNIGRVEVPQEAFVSALRID